MIEVWQRKIISTAEDILNRDLTIVEKGFITSRGGYLALEMIDDTVRSSTASELEKYLNSEQITGDKDE